MLPPKVPTAPAPPLHVAEDRGVPGDLARSRPSPRRTTRVAPPARIGAIVFLSLLALEARAGSLALPVREKVLSNGMRLLLVRRPGDPTLVCGWVARVGSAHDGLETTGLAHMLEHMMFKGTETLGTRDALRDKALNDRQDELQARIREETEALRDLQRRGQIADPTDPQARSPRLQSLLQEFRATVEEQRPLVVRNEIQAIYSQAGATRVNAGTGSDWTVYVANVPAGKLELWFWLESDRLRAPVFREFYTEREVVKEERRSGVEAEPGGEAMEAFAAMIWQAHPYQWCTFSAIGWPTPLTNLTRMQAEKFFRTYYAPGNITAIVVGDFDPAEAERMAESYFGRIPRAAAPPPALLADEPRQQGEQRMIVRGTASPRLVAAFKGRPALHRDAPALTVLERALNGSSGRLEQGLIKSNRTAVSARARLDLRKYGGLLHLEAVPTPGTSLDALESALDRDLERLGKEPLSAGELARAKNQALAAYLEQAENPRALVWALAEAETNGTFRDWLSIQARLEAVTAESVLRVAAETFRSEGRNVLRFEGPEPAPSRKEAR
jgi:predicted Zn-dependent peptidase